MLVLFYGVFIQETPEEGWHDLVAKGFIEYIDTEEEETTMISMTINVSKICHAKYAKLTICRAPKVTFHGNSFCLCVKRAKMFIIIII